MEQNFRDLQEKVKRQRIQIKEHDELERRQRQKSIEQLAEMKAFQRMELNRIVETQRALMNNAPPRQQRLYQRLLEREKKMLYREQQKTQKTG
jgi:hypothetical protein